MSEELEAIEAIGWSCDRITYTLEDLDFLDECFNLNNGRISAVIGCSLDRFKWIERPHHVEILVRLIEDRKGLIAGLLQNDLKDSFTICQPPLLKS